MYFCHVWERLITAHHEKRNINDVLKFAWHTVLAYNSYSQTIKHIFHCKISYGIL